MKKQKKLWAVFMACLFLLTPVMSVHGKIDTDGNATSYTYTLASDGSWIRSQDAYQPGQILLMDSPLDTPEDIFVKNGILYLVENRGQRIALYDLATGQTTFFGEGILDSPSGVFVTEEGMLYVADSGLQKVLVFDENGNVVLEYERPTTKTFGSQASFKPLKVTVDKSGILSILSEGSYDGLIQLSPQGEFLGYFGYNTVPVTFTEMLQDKFFTKEQKAKLFHKIPLTFYNFAQDSSGIIYTITQGASDNAVKKHNVSGNNIINGDMADEKNFVDIALDSYGNIYAVTEKGIIYEYDNDGNLLFTFGGYAITSERNGLITVASGITVDEDGNLYILDKERGLVHTYLPTAFATGLHHAIYLYREGSYEESRKELLNLLMLSGNVSVIYSYLGKDEMQLDRYEQAADYFEKAGERNGYSDAFWEIRNQNIATYLPWFAGLLLCLFLITALAKRFLKKDIFNPIRESRGFKNMTFGFRLMKHPFDGAYEVKVGKAGSVLCATILYVIATVVFTVNYLFSGFAFNYHNTTDNSLMFTILLFAVPVALFVTCSFMVTEINDGKGKFKRIYTAMAYALMPLICILPVITVLTYILSLSEVFLVSFGMIIAYAWTACLVIVCIKEVHEYEFSQVFFNIILTLFMMIVVVFIASVLYMFWDKAADVVTSIFREVFYRVGKK